MGSNLDPAELSVALRVLDDGPADVEWLTQRLRRELRDARLDEKQVAAAVQSTTVLVGRPDGRVSRLIDLLEGQTLTHRVTVGTANRTDLWTNLSLQPLHACALMAPIPLATGGALRAAEFGHAALVGPQGWLPDVPPGAILALSVRHGQLRIASLPSGTSASPEQEQAVRATLARHIREEAWWSDFGDPDRAGELNRAFGHALLEDPDLFRVPVSPLIELLHDVLSEHSRRHLFDDTAAWDTGEVVAFSVAGMPQALHGELSRRAGRYGMSLDRFIVATLGHAAWRTPFAEDLGPWEDWDLSDAGRAPAPRQLRPVDDRPPSP